LRVSTAGGNYNKSPNRSIGILVVLHIKLERSDGSSIGGGCLTKRFDPKDFENL
jgi:hypothetical protein